MKKQLPKPPFGIKNASRVVPSVRPDDSYFQQCTCEKTQHQVCKHVFDGEQYALWFMKYCRHPDKSNGLRKMVQIDTLHSFLRGKYYLPNGESVLINKSQYKKSVASTRFYTSEACSKLPGPKKAFSKTSVTVIRGDCLAISLWLKKKNPKSNPVCLIMASSSNPGGGYRRGAAAQEENLHRRTNLWACTDDPYLEACRSWSYPLAEFGGLYIGSAIVIRDSEEKGYAYLKRPELMSFVAVSAYSNPPTETAKNGEVVLAQTVAKKIKMKIKAILDISQAHGHDSVVLSAFGCGAYGNPPGHVARLFQEVINTSFLGVFEEIVFAIYEDHNSYQDHNPAGNVEAFGKVFKIENVLKYPEDFEEYDSADEKDEKEVKDSEKEEAREKQEEEEKDDKAAEDK